MTLAAPTMTPDELAAFVAEQTQEKPRYICTVCGGPKVKAQGVALPEVLESLLAQAPAQAAGPHDQAAAEPATTRHGRLSPLLAITAGRGHGTELRDALPGVRRDAGGDGVKAPISTMTDAEEAAWLRKNDERLPLTRPRRICAWIALYRAGFEVADITELLGYSALSYRPDVAYHLEICGWCSRVAAITDRRDSAPPTAASQGGSISGDGDSSLADSEGSQGG